MSNELLRKMGYNVIRELETDRGILASGKEEIFGCVFGRDSLITSMALLKTYRKTGDTYLLQLVKKILLNLISLQGTAITIESGEEPGKCIHEFRPTNHGHLTQQLATPWYVYPDGGMRNYDSVDATPLFLIALHEYYRATHDDAFLAESLPGVRAALEWIFEHGDHDHDGLIDYRLHADRTYGGLHTQSWMDSSESLFHEDGQDVPYPIAPVEVQAYAYCALRAWADHFKKTEPKFSRHLAIRAAKLKRLFAQKFILVDQDGAFSLAFAIDGDGRPLTAARSSMSHVLWASYCKADGTFDCILPANYVPLLVGRLMMPDLFEPLAGIRTLSTHSKHFNPQSYHNGSIWPHDTAVLVGALENFGYLDRAAKVRIALFSAYRHFETPIELFVFKDGEYGEYCSAGGQGACRKQAWSAAALLAEA
jgi:glycogen debranching enzyme